MYIVFLIVSILAFSFLLIRAADLTVVSLRLISSKTKTGIFAMSALILAVGTSFPELFVGFTSALEGTPNLSLGVVVGSNIANISLVAGAAALYAGRVKVAQNYLKRDVAIALIASLAPVILILDGGLNRVDGLVLLAIYASYASSFFKKRYVEVSEGVQKETPLHLMLRNISLGTKNGKEYGKLFVGVALLLLSSNLIVRFSTLLAEEAGVPVFLVGLFVLAIGTSLPELAFSYRSLRDNESSMFFGNLLGSTIANSTLIIGVAAVISPVQLRAFQEYLIAAGAFVIVFMLFWIFIRSKHRLDRWEAAALVIFYLLFVLVEFL